MRGSTAERGAQPYKLLMAPVIGLSREHSNAECCVAYNLMKLDRHAFAWTGDARWMDHYERALFNCRLGTQNAQGLKQYFFPLASGYWRAFGSPEHSFWCCTGTGAEEFAKFADTIYFQSGEAVYVNQFIASQLNWPEQHFDLQQHTRYPAEPMSRLTVRTSRPQQRSIHLRIPRWIAAPPVVKINGQTVEAAASPGSYLELRRTWNDGDSIQIELPMRLTEESLPGDATTVAALYGPLVLAADLGPGPTAGPIKIVGGRGTFPADMPEPGPLPVLSDGPNAHNDVVGWIEIDSSSALHFKGHSAQGPYTVRPLYQVQDQRYSVYWQRPTVTS